MVKVWGVESKALEVPVSVGAKPAVLNFTMFVNDDFGYHFFYLLSLLFSIDFYEELIDRIIERNDTLQCEREW